ncbi:hypothetical protein EDD15DRAFT_2259036, partial [Pisolithus albus]
ALLKHRPMLRQGVMITSRFLAVGVVVQRTPIVVLSLLVIETTSVKLLQNERWGHRPRLPPPRTTLHQKFFYHAYKLDTWISTVRNNYRLRQCPLSC